MFKNALNYIRTLIQNAIVAAGGSQADATAFVSSFGDGTLLQLLMQFFVTNGPQIEQFIQFIVSLFAASGAASAATVATKLGITLTPVSGTPALAV